MEMIIQKGSSVRTRVQDTARNYLAASYRPAVFALKYARWEKIEYITEVRIFRFIGISKSILNITMHGSMCGGTGVKMTKLWMPPADTGHIPGDKLITLDELEYRYMELERLPSQSQDT